MLLHSIPFMKVYRTLSSPLKLRFGNKSSSNSLRHDLPRDDSATNNIQSESVGFRGRSQYLLGYPGDTASKTQEPTFRPQFCDLHQGVVMCADGLRMSLSSRRMQLIQFISSCLPVSRRISQCGECNGQLGSGRGGRKRSARN